ncbi:MAG TPA: hypothetical protein VGE21_04670 [Flavobacteriales bacterium]
MEAVLAVPAVVGQGAFHFPGISIDGAVPRGVHRELHRRLMRREAWQAMDDARFGFADVSAMPAETDVVIHFGPETPALQRTCRSTYGAWLLCDVMGRAIADMFPGIAAWAEGARTLTLTLKQLEVEGTRIRMERTYPLPADHVGDALSDVLMHAADLPAHLCLQLLQGALPEVRTIAPSASARPALFGPILALLKERIPLLDRPQRRYPLTWNIGTAEHSIVRCLSGAPYNVRWLPPPGEGASRTNPAGYLHEDRLNVLYAKEGSDGRKVIARVRPKADQLLKRSRTMLSGEQDHEHPFTLVIGGETFAVLGAPGNKGVVLYRITPGNDALEPAAFLCDTPLFHAILFTHADRWWLMGTVAPFPDATLEVFHAEQPEGPYRRHARSPVKVDIRSAKPAGTPFVHEGALYRPAQDLSAPERPQVVMLRITELTADRFEEEPVFVVPPVAGSIWDHATSTLHAVGDILLVGGARRPPGVPAPVRRTHRSFDDE